ncbi:uncharacterized protein CIMG_05010 [Coccidioides immitis RS]|uniref:PNPLA domain-containing protein n=1 Tax=Coccidioides immitis (strain RS) TaxID=246410 RepID=A0A0E1RXE5_COCIM|nr:uncharacterized protein CIMG_05010 [Coccidioides immitis RS]EAS33986.2 hypothetical protein CIMG_05010 [Coccidioides immitis RS]
MREQLSTSGSHQHHPFFLFCLLVQADVLQRVFDSGAGLSEGRSGCWEAESRHNYITSGNFVRSNPAHRSALGENFDVGCLDRGIFPEFEPGILLLDGGLASNTEDFRSCWRYTRIRRAAVEEPGS